MQSDETRFAVLRFDGGDLVFARLTREHPRAIVDMLSEPRQETDGLYYHQAFLVRGVGPRVMEDLERQLQERYEAPVTLRRDAAGQSWTGRIRMKASNFTDSGAFLFSTLHAYFGTPWCHVENGIMSVRAEVIHADDAKRLTSYFAARMGELGKAAVTEVHHLPPSEVDALRDLRAVMPVEGPSGRSAGKSDATKGA